MQDNQRRTKDTPQSLSLPVEDLESFRYTKIKIYGQYISDTQFILDNQVHNRKVGYNILTPFKLSSTGDVVLVDRGWVALEGSRQNLPKVSVNDSMRYVVGTVYVPFGKPYSLGEIDDGGNEWPRLIQYLEFNELAKKINKELLPFSVRLDKEQEDEFC